MTLYQTDLKNNYYAISNKNIVKKITSKEFYEKTKYDKTILRKLKKSVYPLQGNDYIILRFPHWYPNDYVDNEILHGKYVPVDYKISNVIKYLWSKKIITMGCDEPFYIKNKYNVHGFISFNHKTYDKKDTIEELKKIFDEKNIEIIDYIKNPSLLPLPGIKGEEEARKERTENWSKIDKKIILTVEKGFIAINFFKKNLKWIHKKLGIKSPKKKESSKGSIILTDIQLERFNLK
jgi:hypothetical protein